MTLNANLAVSKQAFEKLMAMRQPSHVLTWNPSPEQRDAYIGFTESALDGLEQLEHYEQRRLFAEGHIHSFIPESLLTFVREQIVPHRPALRAALDHLDPNGKMGRDLLLDLGQLRGTRGRLRDTFDEGIQQLYEMIDRNPDTDYSFTPDTAYRILDSKLIQFDPDGWLDRTGEILPVRTHKTNHSFSAHIRIRLEELYRVYVFGCWLSVFGLSRAILEYSIIENLEKFKIDPRWPAERDGTRREKKLSDLIDEVSEHLPQYETAMTLLRDYGNEYMHPKKSKISKEWLFQRQGAARKVVSTLVEVVEALYLSPREN